VAELSGTSVGANIDSLSADGGDFAFATPTALAPPDQNTAAAGQAPAAGTDVYEWREGHLLLVSDGLSNWPVGGNSGAVPAVSGINPSGRDIFFEAPAQLTPDALDGYARLYDARVGGGFEFPVPPRPCPLEVCQGTPKGAPEEPLPGTAFFQGPGNQSAEGTKSCPKGKVRRHGKCVKKAHKPKHKKHHRVANGKGRAGR
jgi:hypothetical protein